MQRDPGPLHRPSFSAPFPLTSTPASLPVHLPATLRAWGTPAFNATLQQEVTALGIDRLPLQAGLRYGSHALPEPLQLIPLSGRLEACVLRLHVGMYYTSVIAGCSCADDPTPVDRVNEYCEAELCIDTRSACTTIRLL